MFKDLVKDHVFFKLLQNFYKKERQQEIEKE